jgi:hypothetical protein
MCPMTRARTRRKDIDGREFYFLDLRRSKHPTEAEVE